MCYRSLLFTYWYQFRQSNSIGVPGGNVASYHYWYTSNSNIRMFLTNSNLCLLTQCYAYRVKRILHQRHTLQDNTILPTEVANLLGCCIPHAPRAWWQLRWVEPNLLGSQINQISLSKNTRSELETDRVKGTLGKDLRLLVLKQHVSAVI